MAKAMTKAAIVGHLAEKAELTKNSMSDILDALASLAYKEATNGFDLMSPFVDKKDVEIVVSKVLEAREKVS